MKNFILSGGGMKIFFQILFGIFCISASLLSAKISMVVFGYGGVVATYNEEVFKNYLMENFYLNAGRLNEIQDKHCNHLDKGGSPEEFWESFVRTTNQILPMDWYSSLEFTHVRALEKIPGTEEILIKLKEKGIRLAMLSNIDAPLVKAARRAGHYEPFDLHVLSCEIRIAKPDPIAFQILMKKLEEMGIEKEECVFVDKRLINVEAARNAGISSIQFESAKQLEEELSKYIADL